MKDSTFVHQELTAIRLDTGRDLSTASEISILYKKPSGTKGKWAGTLASGSTTIIEYAPASGVLDESGSWKLQSYVVDGGKEGFGDIVIMKVEPTLK